MAEWHNIKGYEGLYEVGSCGQVKSLARKARYLTKNGREDYRAVLVRILKQNVNTGGYRQVTLSKEGKLLTLMVHRLVAIAFLDNPLCLSEINHRDGNKNNNRIDNLEWATSNYNKEHAYKIGLRKSGKEHHFSIMERDSRGFCCAKKKMVEAVYPVTIEEV